MASGPCTTWKPWRLWPQMLPGLGWAAALIFQWPAGWVRGRSIFSVVRTDIHWISIAVQILHIGRHRRSNRLAKASEGFVKIRQIDHDRNQHWPQVVLSKLVLVCYLCWLEFFYNKGRTLTIPCILSASFGHPEVSHSSFLQNGVNECSGKDSVLASLLEVRCVRFFHGHSVRWEIMEVADELEEMASHTLVPRYAVERPSRASVLTFCTLWRQIARDHVEHVLLLCSLKHAMVYRQRRNM